MFHFLHALPTGTSVRPRHRLVSERRQQPLRRHTIASVDPIVISHKWRHSTSHVVQRPFSDLYSSLSGRWPSRPHRPCVFWSSVSIPFLKPSPFFSSFLLLSRDWISLEKFVNWNEMKCRDSNVSNFKWIEMKWNDTHFSTVDVK
jgi:hypothetical protein